MKRLLPYSLVMAIVATIFSGATTMRYVFSRDDGAPSVPKSGEPSQPAVVGHPSMESPQFNPIAVSGGRVFVANTPAGTVDVIDTKTQKLVTRISVGVDPVCVAVRPDGKEVWVANHVSDSVSVIDTDPASPTHLHVIATVQEFDPRTRATNFDEPVGIAFASNEKAYVALSSMNQIAVIDVASRKVTKRLPIQAQEPRAIAVRNGKLYVVPFESGNQTQLSGGVKEKIDGDLVTFDAYEHSINHNNVLSIGHLVDVVKHPKVPDRDLFVFDTATDKLVATVDGLGTLIYGLAVDSKGTAFVAQTDARNGINGRSGTKKHGLKELENRAFLNRITRIADGKAEKPTFFDLEPLPPKQPEKGQALATPFAIQVSEDDATLVATAAASDKLFTVDARSGEVLGRVEVGAGPRGVAPDGKNVWVLNALDNTVTLVNLSDAAKPMSVSTITLDDPTHPVFKRGRIAFNTAKASTTGTFSCASCHPDGHTDQLLWVLDTPIVTGGNQIMPRSTMPVRGLRDTAPFHWDGIPGDPYGGIHSASTGKAVEPNSKLDPPTSSTRHLIDGGLASTMHLVGDTAKNDEGKTGELSKQDRDDMAVYLLGVPYPQAPKRAYTDELSDRAKSGFRLFHIDGDHDPKQLAPNVCGNCHRMPFYVSTNTPGTGMDAPTWRGAQDRWLILPQGRLNIIEFPFYRAMAEQGAPERDVWRMSWGGRPRFDPVWDMVLEMGTGFSGAFARQTTLNKTTASESLTSDLLTALEKAANDGAVVLECDGVLLTEKPKAVALQFHGGRYVEKTGDRSGLARKELLALAAGGKFVGTVTARHGAKAMIDHPQPALWTLGPIERQRGRQNFPVLHPDQKSMTVSGRHFGDDARIFVNGRRVEGTVSAMKGEKDEKVVITLAVLPPEGMHLLQVQVPDGLFSNEFIIHVAKDADAAAALQRELIRTSTAPRDGVPAALNSGDLAAVKRLIRDKATANRRLSDGSTPLSIAAFGGHIDIMKHLLELGADPSGSNTDGNTPLHAAAFLCREEVVTLLLDNGAALTAKNNNGETPIAVVSGKWDQGLADFYTAIGTGINQKIDLKQIEKGRPKMAERLRAKAEKPKGDPAPAPKEPAPAPNVDPADWAMYNHDPIGWRFNSAERTLSPGNVGKIVEKWQFPAASSKETVGVVHATPTVVNGEVYFGTATFPAFYKLDRDGKQVWVYRNPTQKAVLPPSSGEPITDKLRGAASEGGILTSALVADGAVYFADTNGWVYCLDAATGKENWKVNARGKEFPGSHWMNMFFGSPLLADGKVVFAGGTLEQLISGTPGYPGSVGRGFLVALDPKSGKVAWKHDVGPKPGKLDPPVVIEGTWGKYRFDHGPATSSVWSTPSYDPETNTLFFGTDVNTAPRQPTKENPDLHTEDSCAIAAIDAATGERRWNTQINPGDVWTNSMRGYDPKTERYKDCSIGDTPKIFTIDVDGKSTKVVGAGCKNGGFYVLRADTGKLVRHTPVYTGKPTHPPEKHDTRVLALPSPIGGLQSGCATDGKTIFTNGIDAVRLATQESPFTPGQVPTGGRVTATSVDLKTELWRHERPRIPEIGGTKDKPMYKDVGDIVGSGVAVGNGVAYFTTVGSGKLIALDAATGKVLKEIDLGPVFCGPSLSRGRVYVGGGNTLFSANEAEAFFPKRYTGSVRCFGLPDEQHEGQKPGEAKKKPHTAFRFVNQTGGQFADTDCYWSLDHGKTWHSFADEPTVPCPEGNGRVYFRLGGAPKNFDDRTARWDFIEYALDKAGWHGNTTQVDAFCIPITISLGDKKVGITRSPLSLIASFRKDAPKEFQSCAETDLWILSPCRAGFGAGGPQAKYFDEYIAGVWAKYAKKQPTPSGKWVGEVTGEKLTFTPVSGGAPVSCEKKPTTQDTLLGTGVLATNPQFCAAINRHVLDDPADWNDPAKFFLAEPCNWYAKFFHEHGLGKKAYGFCYDDVADQAAFFSGKGEEVVVTLHGDKTTDKGSVEKPDPATWRAPDDVTFRTANITSEGTRMVAEVFAPKNPKAEKLPTIVMSHGWGGTAESLRPDAVKFAQAGYFVVAFDYRGWGNSDSRLIAVGKPEKKDGKLIAVVKEVREVVDPIDQTTDILNAISWAAGDKQCDADRIGIWGSSFSGGHVVYVAARDPRVKAFVSQVGSMDGRWVLGPSVRRYTLDQAAARTRGEIGYPKPLEKFGTLTGAPVIEKFVGYAPIEDIGRCKDCAKLFLIAEKEELFDNKDHAILAHERATGVKKLVTIKDIKHYGIYNEARDQAQKEAIAWFEEHLKANATKGSK